MNRVFTLFFIFITVIFGFSQRSVIYVKWDATGQNDGSSWSNAYVNLQEAINKSNPGQEIWVAKGMYFPTEDLEGNTNPADQRERTFHLKSGISVFGGFKGNENTKPADPFEHPTILSGDIGVFGDDSDNCYHVMSNKDINQGYTSIRGFYIEKGNGLDHCRGGGLLESNCSIIYSAINFRDNKAEDGGGVASGSSTSLYSFCKIENNYTEGRGGGFTCGGSSIEIRDCIIERNTADQIGGGYFGLDDQPEISNTTFLKNNATAGGGVYLGSSNLDWPWPPIKIVDVVFEQNKATSYGAALNMQVRPAYLSNVVCHSNKGSVAMRGAGHFYISNSLIHDNEEGGLQIISNGFGTEVEIYNSTITGNSNGSGVDFEATNSWGTGQTKIFNTLLDSTIIRDSGATLEYSHCLIPGSKPGGNWDTTLGDDLGGNIDSIPIYMNREENDYRLWKCSAGVDDGDSTLLSVDWFDLDSDNDTLESIPYSLSGTPRILGNQVDIGAYDYGRQSIFRSDTVKSYSNLDTASSHVWINCQTGLPVDSGKVFIQPSDSSASYALVVTKAGCTDTSNCVSKEQIMSLPHSDAEVPLSIYPNPVRDLLTIEDKEEIGFTELQIFTTSGRQVHFEDLNEEEELHKVYLGHLPEGLYILQLRGASEYVTMKLMVN